MQMGPMTGSNHTIPNTRATLSTNLDHAFMWVHPLCTPHICVVHPQYRRAQNQQTIPKNLYKISDASSCNKQKTENPRRGQELAQKVNFFFFFDPEDDRNSISSYHQEHSLHIYTVRYNYISTSVLLHTHRCRPERDWGFGEYL